MRQNTLQLGLIAAVLSTPAAWASGGHNSAIGEPGKGSEVARTVKVEMTDAMRFVPDNLDVKPGETVRFVVSNSGKIKHEFVLGSTKELREHAEQMKKFPEMEHANPNMLTVLPGKTGEMLWRFSKAGKVDIGCLQPGHYDAGMKGAVKVAKGAKS